MKTSYTKQNPADHGTRGHNPEEIPAKWLTAPAFLSTRQLIVSEISFKSFVSNPLNFTQFVEANNRLDTVFNLEQIAPDFSNRFHFDLSHQKAEV